MTIEFLAFIFILTGIAVLLGYSNNNKPPQTN